MMIKNIMLSLLTLSIPFSASAQIKMNNNISDKYPFIASAEGLLAESSEQIWIKLDKDDFDVAARFTSSNNYRREHNALKIEAFGVKSEEYRFSANPKLKEYWVEANSIASAVIEGNNLEIFCGSVTNTGLPSCIIYSNVTNNEGDEVRVNYNRAIIESGLSEFKYDPETIKLGSMEKTVIYAQEVGKKNRAGIWSHSLGVLDIKFE